MTIRLDKALDAWGTPDFNTTLAREIQDLDPAQLPLQQGLSAGSVAVADNLGVMIIDSSGDTTFIHARAGIFYEGIIAGCSCADDPTPLDTLSEYCEIELAINRMTAETTLVLAPEQA